MAITTIPLPLLFCDSEADRPASIGEGMLLLCKDTGKAYQYTDGDYMNYSGNGGGELPIGAVFTSAVSTNPSSLLGYGTWQLIGIKHN